MCEWAEVTASGSHRGRGEIACQRCGGLEVRWFAVRRAFFPAPASVFGTEVSDKRPPRNITCWGAAGCQSDGHQPPPDHLPLTNEHPAMPMGGAGLIPAAAGRGIRRFFRKLATGNSRNCTAAQQFVLGGHLWCTGRYRRGAAPSLPLSPTCYPWRISGWVLGGRDGQGGAGLSVGHGGPVGPRGGDFLVFSTTRIFLQHHVMC